MAESIPETAVDAVTDVSVYEWPDGWALTRGEALRVAEAAAGHVRAAERQHVDTTARKALTALGAARTNLEDCVPTTDDGHDVKTLIDNQLHDVSALLWGLTESETT